ncbi:MAG TPA: response regulator [Polyangia bacterium]|jgi:CheY-like chemotaxis protein
MSSVAGHACVVQSPSPGPSLLLVSDGPFVRRLIAEGLRHDGYRVREADQRGLRAYAAERAGGGGEAVDAILCDAVVLEQDGVRALEDLRRLDWVMPIIALQPDYDRQPTRDLCRLRLDAVVDDVLDLDETRAAVAALVPVP